MSREEDLYAMCLAKDALASTLRTRLAELESTIQAMTETAAEQSRVHVEMHNRIVELEAGMNRLGSMEAFTTSRSVNPATDKELIARIDFARTFTQA